MKINQIYVVAFFASIILNSCIHTINEEKLNKDDMTIKLIDTIKRTDNSCDIDSFLKRTKVPSLALKIYNNEIWNEGSNMALIYFDSLNNGPNIKQIFYFKIIGKSVNKADGAYSEGLGFVGKEFIVNNTQKFISFFNHSDCVDNNDMINWAKILKLELSLDITIDIKQLKLNLKSNCKNCNKIEISNLNKFCEMF